MSTNEFELLKIEIHVLKVHINCHGCKHRVKKLLRSIEGVYTVNIDAEQQKVTVSGNVDAATLIKKLVRWGKHAEVWSPRSNQNQNQEQTDYIKTDMNTTQMQSLVNSIKESNGREFEDEWTCEAYLNQCMGMKALTGEIDQNTMAAANTKHEQMGWDGDTIAGSVNTEDDIKSIMGVAGFQGNGSGFTGLGGNDFGELQDLSAGLPPFQPCTVMMNNCMQDMHAVNNMMNGNIYMHYPQMMNHISPQAPPYTDNYYNFGSAPQPDN